MSDLSVTTETVEDEETVDDETEQDDVTLFDTKPSSLPYFGADFDVAGLVRRLDDKDIVIPRFDPDESGDLSVEGFQRQRVWTPPRAERFIESLLLGWPVPSIFLVVEPDGRYLVLDGQQRLTTLQSFYAGKYPDGKPFALKNVAEHLQDATYATLTKESRRRLNNTFIQAVVIEPEEQDGRDAVYRLFGRLNSGGVSLTTQEIRVALYRGPLVEFVRELNHDVYWRLLFGSTHKKLKDHELILRSLAMSQVLTTMFGDWEDDSLRLETYKPPMAQFLNSYLEEQNDLVNINAKSLKQAFSQSCSLVHDALGDAGLKFNGRLNAAHIDALLGTLIFATLRGDKITPVDIESTIDRLRQNSDYVDFVSRSTSHRDSVYGRLEIASNTLLGS